MTRRAWIMAAVGALLAASLGSFVLVKSSSPATFKPLASWGVFTPVEWQSVSAKVEGRGFAAPSIHVVEGLQLHDRRALALVAATSAGGHTCFVPVHGLTLGRTICRLTKPVVLYTVRDYWVQPAGDGQPAHRIPVTDLLGVARGDVAGISLEADHRVEGLSLIEHGSVLTFAGGYAHASVLRARDAGGRVLVRLAF